MKISGYYKSLGNDVFLKTDYQHLEEYDKVFISKVFTDTPVDNAVLKLPNVEYGGTGFFYDKAPKLHNEIEHHMPDYHLYDDFVNEKLEAGGVKEMIINIILITLLDLSREDALDNVHFV